MIIDEVVIERLLMLQKAYPSKSGDVEYLKDDINTYFSKEEIEQRVSILCKSILDGKQTGKMLYTYYPLFLFFSSSYKDGRKIIFDKTRQASEISAFKRACTSFGIPFHLKKHGNSGKKVFRILPSFKELELDEVRKGDKDLTSELWAFIWNFLLIRKYVHQISNEFWIINNSLLKVPIKFWRKAVDNIPEFNLTSELKPARVISTYNKEIRIEFEIRSNVL